MNARTWLPNTLCAALLAVALDAAPSQCQSPGGSGAASPPPAPLQVSDDIPRKFVEEFGKKFREADKDGDGRIGFDEASSKLKPHFKQADTNGDGFLDAQEYITFRIADENRQETADAIKLFRAGDKNNDGKLSYDELTDKVKPFFRMADANGDGTLDLDEFINYRLKRNSGEWKSPAPVPGGPGPGGDRGVPDPRGVRPKDEGSKPVAYRFGKLPKGIPSWFAELDLDRDGQVGLWEWRKGGKPLAEFVEMDLNRDGLLTAEEWLRYQRLKLEKEKVDELVAAMSDASSPNASRSGSPSSRGPSGGKYRGPGGPGGGPEGLYGGGPPRDSQAGRQPGSDEGGKKMKMKKDGYARN